MNTDVDTAKPRATTGGLVATIILCIGLLGFGTVMAVLSFFLAFAADACGQLTCNDAGISAGILVSLIGSIVATLLGVVFGIIWAARRKRLGWIFPLAGGVVVGIAFGIGAAITIASSGGSFS